MSPTVSAKLDTDPDLDVLKKVVRLSPFGRRILIRHAMITPNGDVGAKALSVALNCPEATVWAILKTKSRTWYEDKQFLGIVTRLCQLLKVDHSWLCESIDYGNLGEVRFDLQRLGGHDV